MDTQTSLFNNFFIKNRSHGTIHTFKNYFATVFSIFNFSKINFIQTDPFWLGFGMGINYYPSAEIIELYLGLSLGYVS